MYLHTFAHGSIYRHRHADLCLSKICNISNLALNVGMMLVNILQNLRTSFVLSKSFESVLQPNSQADRARYQEKPTAR